MDLVHHLNSNISMYILCLLVMFNQMSKNLYGFTNEPTSDFTFLPPSSQRPRANEVWGAPGLPAPVASFSSADNRTSYSTQTVFDVKITVVNNKVTPNTKTLTTGHVMFIDNGKDPQNNTITPISLQKLNHLLALDDSLTHDKIRQRFKLLGVVVSEDSNSRGITGAMVHSQVFTVGVQGTFSVYDYWSSANQGNIVRKYDDCFFVLKKMILKKKTVFDFSPTDKPELPSERHVWQVVPYSGRGRTVPVQEFTSAEESRGSYWYFGNIHEYASLHNVANESTEKSMTSGRNLDHLLDHNAGMPIQMYVDCSESRDHVYC